MIEKKTTQEIYLGYFSKKIPAFEYWISEESIKEAILYSCRDTRLSYNYSRRDRQIIEHFHRKFLELIGSSEEQSLPLPVGSVYGNKRKSSGKTNRASVSVSSEPKTKFKEVMEDE